MTREEENRKIAEWLGWKFNPNHNRYRATRPQAWYDPSGIRHRQYPNFYTDEAANAMVLEKIRTLDKSIFIGPDYVEIFPNTFGAQEPEVTISDTSDRKTAICEAALTLINTPLEGKR